MQWCPLPMSASGDELWVRIDRFPGRNDWRCHA